MKIYPTKHPYYMAEGCYFSNDCHMDFKSWADFMEEFGDADVEYNHVFRYDWEKDDVLKIYFIMQRKAYPLSCHINVSYADTGKEVEEFLKKHWAYTKKLWKEFDSPQRTAKPTSKGVDE